MNTLQMTTLLPIRFACDSIPDCQGQIVERIGSFVIIQGMATDSGYWFAKGVGGARRFGNRQEVVDYIEYAQDAKDGGPGSGPTDKGKGPTRNKSETDKLHPKDMSRYEIERELTSVPAGSERHKFLQQHYKGIGSSNKG